MFRNVLLTATTMAALTTVFAVKAQDMGPRPAVARISAGVMAGQLLTKYAPVYPADAKAAHVQGTVVLHAIIGTDGLIQNLAVVSGPEMLQSAALDAVKQWTYRPYTLNGVPTAVDTVIQVNFHLSGDPPPDAGMPPPGF